jgi:hypothetical protein
MVDGLMGDENILNVGKFYIAFPLTPAPSLREREKLSGRVEPIKAFGGISAFGRLSWWMYSAGARALPIHPALSGLQRAGRFVGTQNTLL